MEMETITTAIGTAITSLSTNIQTMIGTNLPALLGGLAVGHPIRVDETARHGGAPEQKDVYTAIGSALVP